MNHKGIKLYLVLNLLSVFFTYSALADAHPPPLNPLNLLCVNVTQQSVQHFPQTQNREKL